MSESSLAKHSQGKLSKAIKNYEKMSIEKAEAIRKLRNKVVTIRHRIFWTKNSTCGEEYDKHCQSNIFPCGFLYFCYDKKFINSEEYYNLAECQLFSDEYSEINKLVKSNSMEYFLTSRLCHFLNVFSGP